MKKAVPVMILIWMLFAHPVMGDGKKPLVVATIGPLAAIVEDAFGDSVDVVYLIPLGADPHEYQLSAEQIALLQRADVVVTTGGHLPVEKKIEELKSEGSIGGEVLFLDEYAAEGFRYLPEHWYTGKDNPHGVWLDPQNALAIARAVEKALKSRDPANALTYQTKYENFEARVNVIVTSYRHLVEGNHTAVIQMPSCQYALEWLGIKPVASIKPEEEVPAVGADELLSVAKSVDIIVYMRESPEQMKESARELASKSGRPLAEITVFWSDRPYTEVLIENSAAILKALEGKTCTSAPAARGNVTRYAVISLLVGLTLGTAFGVLLKK
ncbi:MAG: zinc/manganese transport system substrate-binding protein [Thermococcaceae archaeon]|nr:zinc/manganese transport system substrate-binding protein [Thermococcaceae archaeon]MDK2914317.1 zinc/manganese transport system substrate-binding protein [Thermococcaceae archaeon]